MVQNIFCLYDVTGFTQLWHSIPVATKFIAKVSLDWGALGWVLFSSAPGGWVGFVPININSVPFDYSEAMAQRFRELQYEI